jgi:hypothetical protein
MLHSIERRPSFRRVVRRGVRLGCEITTSVLGPRRELLIDLSPHGARVATEMPVTRGEYVLLHFASEKLARRVETLARVVHANLGALDEPTIGIEFVGLGDQVRGELARALCGVPPPLPRQRRTVPGLVWIERTVTWEEDLDDRVNRWTVRERVACLDDGHRLVECSCVA